MESQPSPTDGAARSRREDPRAPGPAPPEGRGPLCTMLTCLIDAWNDNDWVVVRGLYRPDITWLTPIGTFTGRQAVLARHQRDAARHPEASSHIVALAEDPPSAFMEIEAHRRDNGQPIGTPNIVSVATAIGGQITVLRSFWYAASIE